MVGDSTAQRRLRGPRWWFAAASLLIVAGVPLFCLLWRQWVNEAQSCANCRSFMRNALRAYSADHGGWFPFGGKDEWDSLAKCIGDNPVHVFTSHELAQKAEAHWKATGTLSEEVCCYRYNEGLRDDDPTDMVIAYCGRPTRWECREHYVGKLGRPCLMTTGIWEWKSELEFQELLARTHTFLAERRAKARHR